jgi:3-deoxy-D-arabino-heptulosonate 7-phosphate (DAHP) synthase
MSFTELENAMTDLDSIVAIQDTQVQSVQAMQNLEVLSGVDTMCMAIAGPCSPVKSCDESTGYWERFNQYRSRMRELRIKRALSRKA